MTTNNAAFEAEQAAIAQMQTARQVPYTRPRVPSLDRTAMFSAPERMLKDAKPTATYLWRKPDDPVTKDLVARGVMQAVTTDRLDRSCGYAFVDAKRLITSQGPKEVVRTPAGLGLFEVPNAKALADFDKSLIPGDHFVEDFQEELGAQQDKLAADAEAISNSSLMGRVNASLTSKDTRREMIG